MHISNPTPTFKRGNEGSFLFWRYIARTFQLQEQNIPTFKNESEQVRGGSQVGVSTFRRHISLGRNMKCNDFFTLEQRNVERKRNFLRSNVIFAKISRFARTKRETQFFFYVG
jgi:hypothetical protein